ncbi:TPA: hypothetical protein I8038_000794 [Legionella pneumophila]|nr:hypothetical protein [Legionella pneumophila]
MDLKNGLSRKGLLLILLIICGINSLTAYSNITKKPENKIDNSTNLKIFLENKSKDKSFLFNIEKQGDTYEVQIQHNNETETKAIPKATVDDFFQNNTNSSGQDILNIIDIGGKK